MFDELLTYSPDAVLVVDPAGLIRAANSQAERMFGFAQSELVGQPIEMLVPEHLRSDHVGSRTKFVSSPRTRPMGAGLALFARKRDGKQLPVDIMLNPVETPDGRMVLAVVRDVTEQRRIQDALSLSEQHFRSIIESVREYAIFLLEADGRVASWSPGAELIMGYEPEEIIGQHFSRFFTSEDVDRQKPAQELEFAASRGRYGEEGWRVRKDGSRFWANVVITAIRNEQGKVTGFSKVTRDFTERKTAENAVLAQFSAILLSNLDAEKLLAGISASVQRLVPHDIAALMLHDEGSGVLRVQLLHGPKSAVERLTQLTLPIHGSIAGRVFTARESLIIPDLQHFDSAKEHLQHLTQAGLKSGCWVPLIHGSHAIGTLMVGSASVDTFTKKDSSLLELVAGQVASAVDNALAFRKLAQARERLLREKQYLEEEFELEHSFSEIIGEAPSLKKVLNQAETVAPTDSTVLVLGETGTGKELIARAIHRLSARRDRPFVKLNCAAIPSGLLESELFGHEKGAFTGAVSQKIGRLELANQGTLFLDEFGEIPLELQPKLLRALQEKEFERLGGTRTIPVDFRLIAATNRDLKKMVSERQFRSDLYYRLQVFPIELPPLRERRGDIPLLVNYFVDYHARRLGKKIETVPEEVMETLKRWDWPGNIRELENFLERAVILSKGPVLRPPLMELHASRETPGPAAAGPTLESAERAHILRALRDSKGMIAGPNGAASRLGLKRTTLNSKIKKLGITRRDYI